MIVLLIALLAFIPGCSSRSVSGDAQSAQAASVPAVAIETSTIGYQELKRTVEAVGTLDPNEEVTVTNQVEGIVEKIHVDLGDAVRAGQVIAELDTRELTIALAQQQAALQQELARIGLSDENAAVDEAGTTQVRQAEANYAEAKAAFDRIRKLSEQGVVPQQQFDAAKARYEVSEAALRSSRETVRNIRATISARKAAVALAEKKLADARVIAPMSGFVKERLTSAGQYLRSNSNVVSIVQTSPLKLKVDVPESAIDSVKAGRPVQFKVDAFPARTFEGRISRISPAVNQQSRTLKLEVLAPNPDGALRPGLFARVVIETDKRDRVLTAPADAVVAFAGLEKLFVVESGKIAERVVRTGSRLGARVEIVDGVKEGELVAVSNLGSLQQGREVISK